MDSDVICVGGALVAIEGGNSTFAKWEGQTWNSSDSTIKQTDGTAWLNMGATVATNTTHFESRLSMSDDGYADLARKLEKFLAPSEVIVKCSYCGQWAAVKTSCRHCGAAVG